VNQPPTTWFLQPAFFKGHEGQMCLEATDLAARPASWEIKFSSVPEGGSLGLQITRRAEALGCGWLGLSLQGRT